MATGMNEPENGPTSAILLKLLECPVCLESPMIQPVYQCEIGHSVCSSCRSRLVKCGICKKKFTDARNYVAEHIAESFKFYCKYKDEGCTIVNTRQALILHQMTCPFRLKLVNLMLNILLSCPSEEGVSRFDIEKQLNMPSSRLNDLLEELSWDGLIYATIDDDHFKATD